tara:strand:+ start:119 stop:1309 length:1191 start_codon:yes stop_codon:yes gene_type:complete
MIAQVSYDVGYIIDNSGNKIDCFIKDLDWSNTPTEFQYKLTKDSKEITIGTLNSIKAFGIGNHTKYTNATVSIDRSPTKVANMSRNYEPDFITETVFLKWLVEGSANLYEYQDNQIQRFFYNTDIIKIEQLIYKKFLLNSNSVSINNSFKKQIYDNLKCETLFISDSKLLNYSDNDLVDFFQKYNVCTNKESRVYEGLKNKGKINLSAKIGYFSSSLNIDYDEGFLGPQDRQSAELDSKSSIRIAAEVEYVLPLNNNKWSIFLEPGYQSYNASETYSGGDFATFEQTVTVDYQYVDVPFGLRHYMFLNNNSKLFVSAAFVFVLDLSKKVDYEDNNGSIDLPIKSSSSLCFGLGFNYLNRFSIEARLSTPRDITSGDILFTSKYRITPGLVLGYNFL